MLLKYLEYFEAVYRHKSFTKAADELYVTQPAISSGIRKLEEKYGVDLGHRSNRKITFTNEGECLIKHIDRIFHEINSAEEALSDLRNKQIHTLRLGLSPTVGTLHTNLIYSEFIPSLEENEVLYIDEGGALEQIDKVIREELDIAYNAGEGIKPDVIDFIAVLEANLYLIMKEDHPLSCFDRVPFSSLQGENMGLLDENSWIYHQIMQECERMKVQPRIVSKHILNSSYMEAVASGTVVGIAAVSPGSDYHTSLKKHNIIAKPFEENLTFQLGFILKKGRHVSPFAQKFMRYMKRVLLNSQEHVESKKDDSTVNVLPAESSVL